MAIERESHPRLSDAAEEAVVHSLIQPPSQGEIARRQRVFAETRALREAIGPIDLSVEELLVDEDEVGG